MPGKPKRVRIVVCGDAGAGKSSLIASLLAESFPEKVPAVLQPVALSAESNLDGVELELIDTSSRPEHVERLERQVRSADVVVVVFEADRTDAVDRLASYWLPELLRVKKVPVVLVANKVDLRGPNMTSTEFLESRIQPLGAQFRNVELCFQASASAMLNVTEAFMAAQKAALVPVSPLYSLADQQLQPEAELAVARVFDMVDTDHDGVLSDAELSAFQKRCFGAPLSADEIAAIKQLVSESDRNALVDGGIALSGFATLFKVFVRKGQVVTAWRILNEFGYGSNLRVRADYVPDFPKRPDESYELTPAVLAFLADLFARFDLDQDGVLSEAEQEHLFSHIPDGHPWGPSFPTECVQTTGKGAITLSGWLSQWNRTVLFDVETTVQTLVYLGCPILPAKMILVTPPRGQDRANKCVSRNVFQCLVFGARACGKTSFVQAAIGAPFTDAYTPTHKPQTVSCALRLDGSDRTLVMHDVPADMSEDVLSNEDVLASCDLFVFMYSVANAESFARVAQLNDMVAHLPIPRVFLAAQSDLDALPQEHAETPEQYCGARGMPTPVAVSVATADVGEVVGMLTALCLNPDIGMPSTVREGGAGTGGAVARVVLYGAVLGGLVVGARYAWRWWKDTDKAN